ncbi:MAG: AraC family transcriptional regulator [Bacteroidales bacterium]|nr:AraC family transcriptional regulator [Bacteroidales bacterium]
MGYIVGGMGLLLQTAENQSKTRFWTVIYIKEGRGMYMIESRLLSLNTGDLLILPPTARYRFDSASLGDEYNENIIARIARFDEGWLDDLTQTFPDLSRVILNIKELKDPMYVKGPKWMKISLLLDSLLINTGHDRPQKILDLLEKISDPWDIHPIMTVDRSEEMSTAQKIEKINNYISCNLCRKISLEEVADYINMNRIYFCMFFKNHFKEGFSDHVNRKRIEKARGLLLSTDKSMPSIASECGFKTLQYFTRVFTRMTGTTPGKYRTAGK